MKFDLQYFADEPNEPAKEKLLTQEEVDRLIAQNKSKAKEEAQKEYAEEMSKLKSAYETQLEEATSKLTKDDQSSLELAKASRSIDDLNSKLAQLQEENNKLTGEIKQSQLRDAAIETLTEKNLPVNDSVLGLVIRGNVDDTLKAIDAFNETLLTQQKQDAQSTAPKTSYSLGQSNESPQDIFRNANILNKN